ncbi:TrbC/VirB2 family protein [Chitinimonas sp. BJB300]|uniref:TrbC/VirB2 family protein n=1 Tax=Chitinimonas sp. BJB300 TaxID=1559339 RepID=UPI0013046EDF|nr:TrbC/VirB2 family protein [Chitinimonas sp. BJB300]
MKPINIQARNVYAAVSQAYYRTGAKLTIALLAILAMMPPAHADVLQRFLNKGVDLLTNKYARAAGIIAIACLGYKMKIGELDKRRAMFTMFGIAIVIGAPTIYDQFAR